MDTPFACHLPIAIPLGGAAEPTYQSVIGEVLGWLRDRIGVPDATVFSSEGFGQVGDVGPAGANVSWLSFAGASGQLRRWDVTQADSSEPHWRWHTSVWVRHEAQLGSLWLRCSVAVGVTDGRIQEPPLRAGRPGVATHILTRYDVIVDGRRITTEAWGVGGSEIGGLISLILDAERQLPVIVVTPGPDGGPLVDPGALAYRLGGVAHVVNIRTSAQTYELTDAFGPDLTIYRGGVRLYWPGFGLRALPNQHPRWLPHRTEILGDGLIDVLFRRIAYRAAVAVGPPPLEEELALERIRTERQEIQHLREAAAKSGLLDDPQLVAEFERLVDAESVWRLREEDLLQQVARLENDLTAMRRNFREIAAGNQDIFVDAQDEAEEVGSILGAVERARSSCDHLVFLDEAVESAAQSEYDDPEQVYADLLALNRVAQRWDNDEVPQGFEAAFIEEGIGGAFRGGISQTAETQFRADYERVYRGQRVLLGPHIRRGTGSPSRILRIYWYCEDESSAGAQERGGFTRKFVVGHVGRKLRDSSNR